MTRWPRRSSSSHRCDPRKPAPPVTRQVASQSTAVVAEAYRSYAGGADSASSAAPTLQPAGGRAWPPAAFVERLNEQIAYEFAASPAVRRDRRLLRRRDAPAPGRASSTRQALEERNHAMMMVQYLLDADVRGRRSPASPRPRPTFADIVEPVALALEQERRVSDQIDALAGRRPRGGRLPQRAVHAVVPQGAGRGGRDDVRPAAVVERARATARWTSRTTSRASTPAWRRRRPDRARRPPAARSDTARTRGVAALRRRRTNRRVSACAPRSRPYRRPGAALRDHRSLG